ncbi:MAG: ADP-L-glycero-D-mannoheptose-6-epimerase, partial [Proteobacteria bacterium]|nr:ADP-L-glycero-D-mannoheptose-6-epimerase [Pseudomonadota bacterium]
MYVVTGGAGFIGSNLVEGLNRRGEDDILVVDEFGDASQVRNLAGCRIADYQDKEDFLTNVERSGLPSGTSAVFHMGACSNTMIEDSRYVLKTNFDYSKKLLLACADGNVPLIYASSAAVYGGGTSFIETEPHEYPLNVYAFSKQLFDSYVRKEADRISSQVVALRYFNVYGPRETHKASMASIVYQMFKQYSKHGRL